MHFRKSLIPAALLVAFAPAGHAAYPALVTGAVPVYETYIDPIKSCRTDKVPLEQAEIDRRRADAQAAADQSYRAALTEYEKAVAARNAAMAPKSADKPATSNTASSTAVAGKLTEPVAGVAAAASPAEAAKPTIPPLDEKTNIFTTGNGDIRPIFVAASNKPKRNLRAERERAKDAKAAATATGVAGTTGAAAIDASAIPRVEASVPPPTPPSRVEAAAVETTRAVEVCRIDEQKKQRFAGYQVFVRFYGQDFDTRLSYEPRVGSTLLIEPDLVHRTVTVVGTQDEAAE